MLYFSHGGGYRRGGFGGRLIIGAIMALVAFISYYSTQDVNEITGETQRVAISPEQEIALGLKAAPDMARQYGGLSGDQAAQARVERIGGRVVAGSTAAKTGYRFRFHVLADSEIINAFALPGGQIFMTEALLRRLKNDDQVAGVLGHEIGHVVARHGAEHIAKQQLTQGITGAVTVAAGDYNAGQLAAMAGQLVTMKYGREDELESDRLGVRFMREAGYDPEALIEVMKILASASKGGRTPEFFSTHPNPDNRIARIRDAIDGTTSRIAQ